MAVEKLFGYAVPTSQLGMFADHTYVKGSSGITWECWGASTGGRLLKSDRGSEAIADCLSQSNSQAGIGYGATGVCHQTSNRILYPAKFLVSKAKAYGFSWLAYGDYGVPWNRWNSGLPPIDVEDWPIREGRCVPPVKGGGGDPPSDEFGPSPFPGSGGLLTLTKPNLELKPYLKRLRRLHVEFKELDVLPPVGTGLPPAMQYLVIDETRLGIRYHLNDLRKIIRQKERDSIIKARLDLATEREAIVADALRGLIPGDDAARQINSAIVAKVERLRGEIRSRIFLALFGIEYSGSVEVVDPERAKVFFSDRTPKSPASASV